MGSATSHDVSPPEAEFRARASERFLAAQDAICSALVGLERALGGEADFHEDRWEREGGGGGRTRVIAGGRFLEKGGVNVSTVFGEMTPEFARQIPGDGTRFFATGLSLVLHPLNPHVPTVHANFRHIQKGDQAWVAGGADLTPYFLDLADVEAFHAIWREVCDAHPGVADYPEFRDECDRYFYLPHRGERRGIGGIFFDEMPLDLARDPSGGAAWSFVSDALDRFIAAYLPIARKHIDRPWTEAERTWQLRRRGRYVEFNLLYDRGTTFGLRTGGRVESILMSLPALVRWDYDVQPEAGTPERALVDYLSRPPRPGAPDPRSAAR